VAVAVRFLIGLLCVSCALAAPARRALIWGIDDYPTAIGPLQKAASDALAIADSLQKSGFQTKLGLNRTREEMREDLDDFARTLQDGDVALVYYAGHGVQIADVNFLLPIDASIESADAVNRSTVRASAVLEAIAERKPRLKVLILDACRNNPVTRSAANGGLMAMQADSFGVGTYIAFSAAPGQTALDGLFTRHLAKEMVTPGLAIGDLFIRVRKAVFAESREKQYPWSSDALLESFQFTSGAQALPAAPPVRTVTPAMAPTADVTELLERAGHFRREVEKTKSRIGDTLKSDIDAAYRTLVRLEPRVRSAGQSTPVPTLRELRAAIETLASYYD